MYQEVAGSIKDQAHKIKKKYFDPVNAKDLSINSPVKDLNDDKCHAILNLWNTPKHKVCLYMCPWSYYMYLYVSAAVCMYMLSAFVLMYVIIFLYIVLVENLSL